ncbi:MAG: hypothetical protein H6819_01985 [Phycisphaerales bacterium]|nr:hypothetical protein [Phycisphaerales bacterium]MCB9857018.1 hypothetical protein [Phycisphaerales bacterium]MCB9861855.1 hypothetical protein [Phycisphaerales bacterium]
MFRRMLGISILLCLAAVAPALAQNQEIDKLLEKGAERIKSLPEIPDDLDMNLYYKVEQKETPIGWYQIKLDTVTKEGERFYRYRSRFGYNGVQVGWSKGELMVIMDRYWKPVEVRNQMDTITPQGGKRNVKDRARIKNDKFQRRLFDGKQTKKFKFEYKDVNAVFLPEPLMGELKLDPGDKFALTTYQVISGNFDTSIYEVDKKKDGRTKVKIDWQFSVEDPSKTDKVDVVQNTPPPTEPDKKKDEETEEEKEAKEAYMLIDEDKVIRFMNLPRTGITVRRSDRERVEAIQESLKISEKDIPTT